MKRNFRKVEISGGINLDLKVKWSWCNQPLVLLTKVASQCLAALLHDALDQCGNHVGIYIAFEGVLQKSEIYVLCLHLLPPVWITVGIL